MVEKLKKIKTKQIVLFSILAFMLVLVVGTTYAYFTAKVIGNDEAKNTQVYAGIMSLKLDGTQELNASNMLPGATKEVEFSVENTGTLTTTYELDMKEVYNDFSPKTDLVYTLEQDGNIITAEAEAPSIDEILIPAVVIEPNEKQIYKLKLTFKETGKDQNTNQNKTFTGKIQISGIDSSNYLQAKVLARSINTNTPDFAIADPVRISKEKVRQSSNLSGIYSSISGDVAIGDEYTFNENNGMYTLTNYKLDQTYNKSSIGKYTCVENSKSCSTMYKIDNVDESKAKENFSQEINGSKTVSFASNNDKVVANSYYLNQENGYFILENPSETKNYDASDIGKYTCNNSSNMCTQMYRINNITETTLDNADIYTLNENSNEVTSGYTYTSRPTSTTKSASGLYKAADDDGDSYYFRGSIPNNYVSFANQTWRIVRVNGDGSIRLINSAFIGTSNFNNDRNMAGTAGYTYDNESNCTKDSPCISDYNSDTTTFTNNKVETDSTIKTYLENWYINNLKDYDDKISLSNFCNDTSFADNTDASGARCYKAYDRIVVDHNLSLKCPDTTENYGGSYKLKIGLLSADELNYAGFVFRQNTKTTATNANYLYVSTGNWWHTMTPYYKTVGYRGYTSYFSNNNLYSVIKVRPVINLKSDIQITGGDGSKSNPYIVE